VSKQSQCFLQPDSLTNTSFVTPVSPWLVAPLFIVPLATGYHVLDSHGTTLALANDNKLYAWVKTTWVKQGDIVWQDLGQAGTILSGKTITTMITGMTCYVLTSDNMLFAWVATVINKLEMEQA
jgi:hypothetical protein